MELLFFKLLFGTNIGDVFMCHLVYIVHVKKINNINDFG